MFDKKPPLGIIRYLNMLPYGDMDFELQYYNSPRELNTALCQNTVMAGCISAIVGIKNNLNLLNPIYGIGAKSKILSVYLEPLSSPLIWQNIVKKNKDIISSNSYLECKENKIPLQRNIRILTTGASEQSEWLFSTLLRLQGYTVSVEFISKEVATLPRKEIEKRYQKKDELLALLVIGNLALERLFMTPEEHTSCVIDLAEFWIDAAKSPCIFALWYTSKEATKEQTHVLSREIESTITRFYEQTKAALCSSESGIKRLEKFGFNHKYTTSILENYFANISFKFDEGFGKTLHLYQTLATLFPSSP